MRKLTLLCRIVDNLGDAGVALRLARYWLHRHPDDHVSICTDEIAPFQRMLGLPCSASPSSVNTEAKTLEVNAGDAPANRLTLHQTLDPPADFDWGGVIIEMFGTPLPAHWKQRLAVCNRHPVWVNLEYLSAERWIEDCHGLWSTDPATGWKQLFFFPGFTAKTGGLLGEEPMRASPTIPDTPTTQARNTLKPAELRAFVFAYSLTPLLPWLSEAHEDGYPPHALSFHVASASHNASLCEIHPNLLHRVDFVPQRDFDSLLKRFDLLFVRGEDSFVRAQLAGLPFVWQIYPTEDGAHWTKLDAFFSLYAQGLEEPVRRNLKALWWYWNGAKSDADSAIDILHAVLSDMGALRTHARRWREALSLQCRLIERLEQAIAAKT